MTGSVLIITTVMFLSSLMLSVDSDFYSRISAFITFILGMVGTIILFILMWGGPIYL
jgi:hypothetical protein